MRYGFSAKLSTVTAMIGLSLLCVTAYADANNTLNSAMSASSTAASGEAYLAANKTKPGVVTLPDGLQYKVITAGKGPKPTDNDVVVVDYKGELIDGTEFDSSYKRGQPATFEVSGVIPGWVEALKLMNVGSKWELYIPAQLAYGDQGAPPMIGPNQVLIFTVELKKIKK